RLDSPSRLFFGRACERIHKRRGREGPSVTVTPVQTPAGLEPAFDLSAYYPVLIYAVVAVLLAVGTIASTLCFPFNPRKLTKIKQMPYESGMDPVGSARMQFDIKFYLIAILFLVFDVELLFLYPWAVIAYGEGGDPLWRDKFGTIVFLE